MNKNQKNDMRVKEKGKAGENGEMYFSAQLLKYILALDMIPPPY